MIFQYNIREEDMLGIGYVNVRWIPCRCYSCLRKLASPWNTIQNNYNKDWKKGENQQCIIYCTTLRLYIN